MARKNNLIKNSKLMIEFRTKTKDIDSIKFRQKFNQKSISHEVIVKFRKKVT